MAVAHHIKRGARISSKMPVSEQATLNNIGNAPALFPVARPAIYLLLFAWNILNVRFV
jgi:hypothetical protein